MDILYITDLFMSYVDDFIFEQIVVKKDIVEKIIKRSSEYRKKRRHAIKDNLGKSSEEFDFVIYVQILFNSLNI